MPGAAGHRGGAWTWKDGNVSDAGQKRRVYFLGNPDKREAAVALEELRQFATPRCTVAGSSLGLNGRAAVDAKADRIVVIGGDGTLQTRSR